MKSIKKTAAVAMLSAQAIATLGVPLTSTIVHATEPAPAPTNTITTGDQVSEELVDAKTGLTQVVSVNGYKLKDKVTVNQGDNVTFDIVVTPGNQGLMKAFTDTLPEGLVFNPNSKHAITVFAVNNDGSVGAEVTADGVVAINGKTISWTPNDPAEYFFAGKTGTKNRLLFHITTSVENGVKAGSILENTAETTFDNPKDPENPPTPVTDKAIVEVPTTPKDPGVKKSVYKEATDGSIDVQLPGDGVESKVNTTIALDEIKERYTYVLDVTLPSRAIEKSLVIRDDIEGVQEVDPANIKVYNSKGEDITGQGKVEVEGRKRANVVTWTASGSFIESLNASNTDKFIQMRITGVNVEKANKDDLEKQRTGGVISIPNVAKLIADNLQFESNETLVRVPEPKKINTQWKTTDGIPLKDPVEGAFPDDEGDDIPGYKLVRVDVDKDGNVVNVYEKNPETPVKPRTQWVDLKGNPLKDPVDGSFPDDEGDDIPGYKLVRVDKDADGNVVNVYEKLPGNSITKGVVKQDGKLDTATVSTAGKGVNVPLNADGSIKLPEGDNGGVIMVRSTDDVKTLRENTRKAIARAEIFGVDTTALKADVDSLPDDANEDRKSQLVKTFGVVSKAFDEAVDKFRADQAAGNKVADEIKFETGATSLDVTADTYFKYLINAELNASEVADYIQITDSLDGVHEVDSKDIRVFDISGQDLTGKFDISLTEKDGRKVMVARAKDDYTKEVKAAKDNVKLQVVIFNARVKSDKSVSVKNTADLETGKDKKLTSNETVVNLGVKEPGKPADPATPAPKDPAKPDVKTGGGVAKNPALLGAVGVALLGGLGAVFVTRKRKAK